MTTEQVENVAGWILLTLVMIMPAALLVALQRWLRSWRLSVLLAIASFPLAAFILLGGVGWLVTYWTVVIRGDTSVPDAHGYSLPQYLWMAFGMSGVFGIMFAVTGFALRVPWLVAWRLIHRRSFDRFTRSSNDPRAVSPRIDSSRMSRYL